MPLRVLIVGGGIAGLTAAAALAIKGHTVTVFERVNSATEVGFAFRITENSDRCLKHIGIDTIEGGAVAVKALRMLRGNGEVMFERKENVDQDQNGDQKDGGQGKAKATSSQGTSVFAFRPQLTQQLLDVCLKHGVTVKTGIKITNIDTTKTTLTYDDPTHNGENSIALSADLIIACDGLHSTIRSSILAINPDDPNTEKYHPKPSSSDNCLRFMLPTSKVHSSPTLAPLLNSTFNLASWKADDSRRRILAYPVDFGQQYNLVCTHPQELSDNILASQKSSTYNTPLTPQQTLGIYQDLDPRVHEIIALADPGSFRVWKLMDLEELPRWSRGKTVLIGDAAHAVLPFGFSGASMAIEDAVVLAEILGDADERRDNSAGESADLEMLLKRFEEVRKPRVARVRQVSREIAAGLEDKEAVAAYFGFLSGYDAVAEGVRVRKEILEEV